MRKQACKQINISIHAPTRGATLLARHILDGRIFQSTLPRGERLFKDDPNYIKIDISIHAPTRGATLIIADVPYNVGKFQSTLPRGERQITYLRIRQHF